MWLTRLALRNPVLILMLSLMVLVLGFVSLGRLPVDLFPEISVPVIRVATFYSGAGPADIERAITMPVERAVAAAPGVDRVESASKQGVSVVSVWFAYGTDLDNAQFEVSQRVSQILNTLPPGVQQPFILKFDITNIPVAQLAVSADALDERQLYDLAYNVIEPQIERLPGVASATVGGGRIREIGVRVHRDALRARGLGVLDVVDAVRAGNLLLPSGSLRAGDRDYNVFSNTQVDRPTELGGLVIPQAQTAAGANPVRVRDVAEVVDGTADQANIVRINGRRGVYLRVVKQPGANTIAVVDGLRASLDRLRGVPESVKVEISFDQSRYIRAAITALQHEALQGGALAVLVILVFLLSVRATAIVSVAIPLSIVATFVLLYGASQTLNVFTLGGLALGVGRLVDDSIVELENIHRHLEHTADRVKAVLAAAQEVAMPILVSTITTIVVFLPVLFLAGVARNLFVPLALTIAFALIMSFFVSRTVTPLLCLYLLKSGHEQRPNAVARFLVARLDALDDAYARALRAVLRHRAATVLGILGLFAASLLLYPRIGQEFFPESDESQFTVVYKTPIGTRAERTEQVGARVEEAVRRTLRDARGPLATVMIDDCGIPGGRTALFSPNTGPHIGNLQVNLRPARERALSDTVSAERVRAALRDALPGVQAFFSTGGIVKRILNFGAPAPIDVEILGYDFEAGGAYARRVAGALRRARGAGGTPVVSDVQVGRDDYYPELHVTVDREKAGALGITAQRVAQTVLVSLAGSSALSPTPFTDPETGNEYNISVRLADPFRDDINDLDELFVRPPNGPLVPLASVARVERRAGPVQMTRKYMERVVDVTANVAPGADLSAAAAAVERVLRENPPPDGFTVRVGGQIEAQRQAFSGLGVAALLALALVYMVLASQFRSLVDPLVIMFSVPLGISGVLLALFATGTTLSVNSFMGVIMMVGIAVSNGVLLVDFANVLRRRGAGLFEATVEAGRTRLRPILMTTLATVLGLLPMALGIGEGSETNLPLARAVIGGLTVSTLFTLFLVPAVYTALDRFARRDAPPAEVADDA
ncbi:MAG: efflux RND transporter permease subunit [Polyangiales bacterium]